MSGIYAITCKDKSIQEFYIGSTDNLEQRIEEHKTRCKYKSQLHYNLKVYKFIRENGDFDNWDFKLLEKINTDDKIVLKKLEQTYLDKFDSNILLNDRRAFGQDKERYKETKKEYSKTEKFKEQKKQYYQKNKEKISKKDKDYYLQNKDKIAKKRKEYLVINRDKINEKKPCPKCGKFLIKRGIKRHLIICPNNHGV